MNVKMDLTKLKLTEHPEGGRFREVYRSPDRVQLTDGRERDALTHIYFHLAPGEVSKFHRVEQDEIWNLYQGGPLRLWLLDEQNPVLSEVILSAEEYRYCAVIPAGTWQAAEPLDGDVLTGCSVAPGFSFEDFTLIDPKNPLADWIRDQGLERFL